MASACRVMSMQGAEENVTACIRLVRSTRPREAEFWFDYVEVEFENNQDELFVGSLRTLRDRRPWWAAVGPRTLRAVGPRAAGTGDPRPDSLPQASPATTARLHRPMPPRPAQPAPAANARLGLGQISSWPGRRRGDTPTRSVPSRVAVRALHELTGAGKVETDADTPMPDVRTGHRRRTPDTGRADAGQVPDIGRAGAGHAAADRRTG
jgi:hypothetical protein